MDLVDVEATVAHALGLSDSTLMATLLLFLFVRRNYPYRMCIMTIDDHPRRALGFLYDRRVPMY